MTWYPLANKFCSIANGYIFQTPTCRLWIHLFWETWIITTYILYNNDQLYILYGLNNNWTISVTTCAIKLLYWSCWVFFFFFHVCWKWPHPCWDVRVFFCETNEDESRAAEGASSGSCCPFQAGELESKLLHKQGRWWTNVKKKKKKDWFTCSTRCSGSNTTSISWYGLIWKHLKTKQRL